MSRDPIHPAAALSEKRIPRFRKIDGDTYAGGRPDEEGLQLLARMGIRTIINLERAFLCKEPPSVKKEQRLAEKLGMRMLKAPVRPFSAPASGDLKKLLGFLTNPENRPVFIHCRRGKDRTGIIVAAYRIKIQGWKPDDAYREMVANGFNRLLFWLKSFVFNADRSPKAASSRGR